MDFSRFNQAEQAQIAAMIEHKQVKKEENFCFWLLAIMTRARSHIFFLTCNNLILINNYIDEGFHETL